MPMSIGSGPVKPEVPIAVKSTTEMITVPLDTNEKVQVGQAIANLMVQVEQLNEELKESVTAKRGEINALRGTVREQAKTLANGYRTELATVEQQYDFNTETIRTVLKGKVIKERPMTPEEKQLDLEICLQLGYELKVLKNGPTAVTAQAG